MTAHHGRRGALMLLAAPLIAPSLAWAQGSPAPATPLTPSMPVATPPVGTPAVLPGTPAAPPAPPRPVAAIDRTKTYYVFFEQILDVPNTRALRRQLATLVEAGVSDIVLVINSPGGLVEPTLVTYGFIRALPARVRTHAQVFVQSAATLLYLAGQDRSADREARFLFHPASGTVVGVSTEAQLNDRLQGFHTINDVTAEILRDRTALTADDIARFQRETVVYSAAQAEAVGVVQTVADLQVPGPDTARMLFLD